MKTILRRLTLCRHTLTVALVMSSLLFSTTASAAVFTWTGGGANASWSTTGNWSNGSAPTTGNDLWFNNGVRTTGTNNISSLSIGTITFASPAAAFTLTGSTISLGSITNTSANNQSLSLAVIQSTNGTYTANSNITLSGSLSGSGNITKTGAGSLVLSGNRHSAYSGLIDVTAGTLSFVSAANLPSGRVKLAAGTTFASTTSTTNLKALELAGAGVTLPDAGITLSFNSGTFSNTSGSAYSVSNSLTFLNTSSLDVGNGLTMSGGLGGSGTLTKSGSGTLDLTNSSNGFTGTFNLNAGGLRLGGGFVGASVAAAAGTEVTTAAGPTSFQVSSLTFAAGAASNLTPGGASVLGGLSSSSDITLSANTTVNFDIQGLGDGTAGAPVTNYDSVTFSVNGSGTLAYAGFLNLNFLGSNAFENGVVFQLFDNAGSGAFSGNLDGINTTTTDASSTYAGLGFTKFSDFDAGEQAFLSSYYLSNFNVTVGTGDWISGWNATNQRLIFSQSAGTLTVVPEPSTIVFAGIGVAMFGWSTWTRRRANVRRQAIEASIA